MRRYLVARLTLVGGLLCGCTSWQAPNVAPDQLAKSHDGQRIRVTRNDGSQVVLADARITPTGVSGQWDRTSVGIPTTEIQQLAVRGKLQGGPSPLSLACLEWWALQAHWHTGVVRQASIFDSLTSLLRDTRARS